MGWLRWVRAHRSVEAGVAEGEHPAVHGGQPVALPVRGCRHGHDGTLQAEVAQGPIEAGRALGSHATVGERQPVPLLRGSRCRVGGHRHRDRVERHATGGVEGLGVTEVDDPAAAVDVGGLPAPCGGSTGTADARDNGYGRQEP